MYGITSTLVDFFHIDKTAKDIIAIAWFVFQDS